MHRRIVRNASNYKPNDDTDHDALENNLSASETGATMSENQPFLDVIMPSYMKGSTIVQSVTRLRNVLSESSIDFMIHVVVDGPDDLTEKALRSIADYRLRVSVFPENKGKGSALRFGVSQSVSKYIAFLDADLDIHPNSIIIGLNSLEKSDDKYLKCAYGSKFHSDSKVDYPSYRKFASTVYRLFVRALFRLDVEDSQTGLKIFDALAIQGVIDQSLEQRFLFDLEIFSLLAKKGYRFVPIPVVLDYQYTSTIGLSATTLMIRETVGLAIRRRKFKF